MVIRLEARGAKVLEAPRGRLAPERRPAAWRAGSCRLPREPRRFSGLVEIVSTGEKKAFAGDLELLEILSSEEKKDLEQTAVQPASS